MFNFSIPVLVFGYFFIIAIVIFTSVNLCTKAEDKFDKVGRIAAFILLLAIVSMAGFTAGEGSVVNTPAPYAQQLKKGVVYHVIVRYTDGKNNNILNLTSGKYHGASHKIIVIRVKKAVHFKNFVLNQYGVPVRVPMIQVSINK